MFLLTEIKYRLFRSPGKTLILLSVAALLAGSMAFYLGNIQTTKAALENLADTIPVTVRVVSRPGTKSSRLSIGAPYFDALTTSGVHDVMCAASAAGSACGEPQTEEEFGGGDTSIQAFNSFLVIQELAEASTEEEASLENLNWDFLAGEEALCAVSQSYARQHGLAQGGQLELPLWFATALYSAYRYDPIGIHSLTITNIYPDAAFLPDMVLPIAWLRKAVENAGQEFYYESLSALLDDPIHLTRYKEGLRPMGFAKVDPNGGESEIAISMEDELFIKTAEELRANLRVFKLFRYPFLSLVVLLVMLATFLVLRSSQKEMAIASALGRERLCIAVVHFCSAALAESAGCALVLPVMLLGAGIALAPALGILGTYLLCAGFGTLLALVMLLRFDTLSLLTKAE